MFRRHYDQRKKSNASEAYSIIFDEHGPTSSEGFEWEQGDDVERERERAKSKEMVRKLAMKDPGIAYCLVLNLSL